MVLMRFKSLLPLVLVLFLFCLSTTARLSIAHPHHGGNAAIGRNTVLVGKELLGGAPVANAARDKRLGGRKMVLVDNIIRLEKVKGNGASEGTSKISSSATHFVAKCDLEEMRASIVECEKSVRSLLSEEVDVAGFVAFNADYHAPQHHPPKNN